VHDTGSMTLYMSFALKKQRALCREDCSRSDPVTETDDQIFRPRRLLAVRRCVLLLQMSHVSVSVCMLGTLVNCAKTAEPIEMPFGG